ncbi:MFS transporter [Streptomyces iranensis]|uniref:General substrate transporter n=1 Tax=Streptomyces iranensis TaxID=576784 RepID=A0A060ZQH6_9ACTN|nr:MFS transporter [Streptomyces iranensis]MBP2061147.1 putative MFS family arabinose efflux permease [Streptomyces iranensis]CDR05586.1 General substrate transporter [Streptomyces iranensis]
MSTLQSSTHAPLDVRQAGQVTRAAFVGTALEWYDYFLFGTAAALVFDRLIFTSLNATAAALAALATFGVGFLARPLGAALFGYVGDRYGRRPALLITIMAIGIATGLVGFLPTYHAIGLAAPVALAILRLIQGLAVGGEWGGAMTIAVEHAPPGKRAWYAALVQIGSPVGTLFSSGAFALVLLLPSEQFDAWGWRLPFLAAFPLLGLALYLRLKLEESPVFAELLEDEERVKVPVVEVFRRTGGRLMVAVMCAFLAVGGFYMMTTFAIGYGTGVLGLDRGLMVNATLIASGVQILATLIAGKLAVAWGPALTVFLGGATTALATFPIFWLLESKAPAAVVAAIVLGIVLMTIGYAGTGSALADLFPANLRYTGVSLGYNLAGALSGFMPLLSLAVLKAAGNHSWAPALVLVGISAITAAGGLIARRIGPFTVTESTYTEK